MSITTTEALKQNGVTKDLMIFKGKALSQDQIAALMRETYIY